MTLINEYDDDNDDDVCRPIRRQFESACFLTVDCESLNIAAIVSTESAATKLLQSADSVQSLVGCTRSRLPYGGYPHAYRASFNYFPTGLPQPQASAECIAVGPYSRDAVVIAVSIVIKIVLLVIHL